DGSGLSVVARPRGARPAMSGGTGLIGGHQTTGAGHAEGDDCKPQPDGTEVEVSAGHQLSLSKLGFHRTGRPPALNPRSYRRRSRARPTPEQKNPHATTGPSARWSAIS